MVLLVFIDVYSAILIPTFIYLVFVIWYNLHINKKIKLTKLQASELKKQIIRNSNLEENEKQKINQVLTIDDNGKMTVYQIQEDDKELVSKVLDKCKNSDIK